MAVFGIYVDSLLLGVQFLRELTDLILEGDFRILAFDFNLISPHDMISID